METNEHNPIEFQEKLNLGQLEAKHTLKTRYPGLKYERSTTSRLLKKKLIILPRVIGILNSFLIVPFLRTIYL